MNRKPSWAERHVLSSAGIDEEEITDRLIELAAIALERCYYIDQAAKELIRMTRHPWR